MIETETVPAVASSATDIPKQEQPSSYADSIRARYAEALATEMDERTLEQHRMITHVGRSIATARRAHRPITRY